jgi:hypothetical protein
MIGLGVLATGSGAAALTGATLSNTVSPTADFRVNVEGGLVVEKGGSFPPSDGSSDVSSGFGGSADNSNVKFINSSNSDSQVFGDLDGETSFAAVADDEQNGALNIGIAIPFGNIPDTDGSNKSFEFPDLLKITNNAPENTDVAVAFGDDITGTNGSDASASTTDTENGFDETADGGLSNPAVSETGNGSSPTQLSYDEVAEMFQFTTDGTAANAISPPGASGGSNTNQNEAASVTVNSNGGTQAVHLNVEISTATGQKIHDYVSEESLDTNGGHFSLVDQIFVGSSDATAL